MAHRFDHGFQIIAGDTYRQADSFQHIAHPPHQCRVTTPDGSGHVRRRHHTNGHPFPMADAKVADQFNGMTKGVTEVQNGASPLLKRIFLHHLDFDPHGFCHQMFQRSWPFLFKLGEEIGRADDAMFDHLGQPGAKLGGGQRLQHIDIDQHHMRLLKGTDQVLALWQINTGFAANRSIDHRQERGRNLDKGCATQIGGCGKAGHVANDAATQRNDRTAPVETGGQKLIIEASHGGKRFVLLPLWHETECRFIASVAQAGRQCFAMLGGNHRIADNRCRPRTETTAGKQAPGLLQNPLADANMIASLWATHGEPTHTGDFGIALQGFQDLID